MIQVLFNLIKLFLVLWERGNWKLIRHSKNQLKDFIFCRSGLNKKSSIHVILYWYGLLRGLEVLIWRLETFGFLFTPELGQKTKDYLNSYL